MGVPNKVRDRLVSGLKRLGPIIEQQKMRDVSEADTVTLVKDLLAELFGYDKYTELTGEFGIRGTRCDLAVRIEDRVVELVEVKAIGITLDDRHIRQAVDYAANEGIEWVMLSNATVWRLYEVIFGKPIDKRLLAEIDLTAIDPRNENDVELLYLFTKEGFRKGAHIEMRDRRDASSRFMLAALLLNNENVVRTMRRELRRVVDVLVDDTVIHTVLRDEVIKRDVLEGPAAEAAARKVSRREDRSLRAASSEAEDNGGSENPAPIAPAAAAPATTPAPSPEGPVSGS